MTASWTPDGFLPRAKPHLLPGKAGEKAASGRLLHGRAPLTKAALGASGLGCFVDPVVGRHRL